ncbi:hypothetical protein BV898_13188 [Hypsibius exemplaris]|uniref:Uncharacterized protein n=1 Tax=Hypsibius exemplaris TaxID=2072580 RepID=A0A1W0WBG2_HYPEX|nr:hypothetical protein BV898_13188 [Hypsibius exemplaris]
MCCGCDPRGAATGVVAFYMVTAILGSVFGFYQLFQWDFYSFLSSLLDLILAGILLYGVKQKSTDSIKAWTVLTGIKLMVVLGLAIYSMVASLLIYGIIFILDIPLEGYLIYVVVDYSNVLTKERQALRTDLHCVSPQEMAICGRKKDVPELHQLV